MATAPIKVLVVDDSAFARKVMRECLSAAGIEVVGIAGDGLEALEKIQQLAPDVVTLDLVMPNLDGLGVLKALAGRTTPRVVVVSTSDQGTELGMAALQAGAFEIVHKPTGLAVTQLYEVGEGLVEVVIAAARASPRTAGLAVIRPAALKAQTMSRQLLVVGASTGGPQALTLLVSSLPANFPVPVAIVQHMPIGYTAPLAKHLDEVCALEVVEAAAGIAVEPGRVILARAGRHLKLTRAAGKLECRLDLLPLDGSFRPSVDVLFKSAAEVVGAHTLGLVLTGMGADGVEGAQAIHAAGGAILTEAESSCVVYGMPRAVKEAGLSAAEASIEQMLQALTRFL